MEPGGRCQLDELRMIRYGTIILSAVFVLSYVGGAIAQTNKVDKSDLKTLVNAMAGEFSSEEQSSSDKDFFHIKLRMKPIWSDRKDGYWLYVEQAAAESEDKPYRQRIYRVFIKGGAIESKVFEINDPARYVGAWRDESKLKTLTESSLIDRQGCSILLRKNTDGTFGGSTPGSECLSTLRGAAYATSEVTIHKDRLVSWDRGWNKDGKQVWGAVKGGYVFKKTKSW